LVSRPAPVIRTRLSAAVRPGLRWAARVEPYLYLAPSLALLILFTFYPIARSVYLSLFLTNPLGVPRVFVGLQHYVNALQSTFLQSLGVTVLFVLYTVPVGLLLGLALALLAYQPLKGTRIFQLIFSSPLAISAAIGSTIWVMLLNPVSGVVNYLLGLVGIPPVHWLTDPRWALLAVGMVSIWLRLGFNFVLLLSGLQNVPEELHEAAVVDGAGFWAKTWYITLPLLSPTLFFAAVVGVIHAFQAFAEIEIMTGGGPSDATNTVVYRIYQVAFRQYEFGAASAQAILLFLVMVALTYLQFRLGERRVHYQ